MSIIGLNLDSALRMLNEQGFEVEVVENSRTDLDDKIVTNVVFDGNKVKLYFSKFQIEV